MRKLVIAVLVLIILVAAAIVVVPRFIDINSYRGPIQAELQQRLNRSVSLGPMHLKLLPPSLVVENVSIGEDPRFGSGRFAEVQQLAIALKLGPLLHKQVAVSSLDLVRPHVELIRNAQGQWNFSTLGKPTTEGAAQPSSTTPQQAAPQQAPNRQQTQAQGPSAPPIQLDNLKITDGQVALTDEQKHQSRAVYDHIDVALKDFAPDKNFDFSVAAHLPGSGEQTVALEGKAGPINMADMLATPFDGTLKLNQVSIEGAKKFLNTAALAGTSGVLSGSASMKVASSNLASQGSLKLDNAVVRNVQIGYPISVDYNVNDNLRSDVIQISQANLKLGSVPLAIQGTVNMGATPSDLDMKVNAQNVSLAEAARLAAAFGVAFNANTKVVGMASADIAARGPVNKPALNGTLALRNLAISGQDIPQPVNIPAIDLALTPQQIKSNNFSATAGNTSVSAQIQLTNYTSDSPLADATVRTQNAEIGNLLAMARAYGVSAANGMTGSGLLTLDVHASGPVKNTSAMTFSGSGQLQNASVKPPSLRVPLNVRTANLRFSNNAAQIDNLAASLGQTNASGTLTVRNFNAPNVQFTLTADKVNITELQQITSEGPPPPAPARRASWITLVPQASAQTVAKKRPPRRAGVARAESEPRPPKAEAGAGILQTMTGGGTLQIGTLQQDQLVLTNVRSNVTLDHGVITLSPLTAQLYGGLVNGVIAADTRTMPMTVQVKTSLQKVQANPLISSVSSVKDTIYGLLAANTQSSFQAASASDMAKTLNGTLSFDLTDGRITKLDLLNKLAEVGKFAGVRQNAQAVTDVTKLTGHFNVVNGVASTNDLQGQLSSGTFAANGIVNLATQELNMHLTAVLSKGFSQQVGGTGIGGFMQTALANNRGELVIPVLITGTFDNPHVSPDVEKVAQMKLQSLLPSVGNPGALTTGVLGQVLKGGSPASGGIGGVLGGLVGGGRQEQPATSAPQQQQPANPLNQAIEGLFGGKKGQKK